MRGKTEGIVSLHLEGKTPTEIAKEMDCTVSNVVQAIKRMREWNGVIKPLPTKKHEWLLRTAEKNNVSPAALASKLLEQMVDHYMAKSNGK